MIGSQPFTGAQCNTSNQQCILRVPGSNLTEVGLLNVSVVAFNAVGSGNPTTFPMSGIVQFVYLEQMCDDLVFCSANKLSCSEDCQSSD